MTRRSIVPSALVFTVAVTSAFAQKEAIEGIRNFTKVDATAACGGSTEPSAMAEVAKRGYKTVVSLREAGEAGAMIDETSKAAAAAGMRFVHLPVGARPDDGTVERFLATVKDGGSQPVFVYDASGSRAGAMWLIKRMLVDGWPEDRATSEAVMIGLSSPTLKQFALDYVAKHK